MTKSRVRNMGLFLAFLIIGLLGLMVFVRLAPVDPAQWHTGQTVQDWASVAPGAVLVRRDGALLRLTADQEAPDDLLGRLDAIALATPRTTRLAGSVAEGRITWETRSLIWGFPDYTTAEVLPDGVGLNGRLRFGGSDLGVNAARLSAWQAEL